MKFITPIYEGSVGNVLVLNHLLTEKGIENLVPRTASLSAFAYYDECGIITIELSYVTRFGETEIFVVQQDCDEYYFLEMRLVTD